MTATRRAFIFDMDGTIVDNMSFHTESWIAFFQRRGKDIDADEFFRTTAGRQGKEIIRAEMGEHLSDDEVRTLNDEKELVYRELYEPHRKTVTGFDGLIALAKEMNVALAVATAAPNANITFTLDGLDLRRHFDTVVGAADVARGKPHPDVFLLAAERCGVAPEHCIVFEDAPLGVEAARRAGMRAVVLTTTLPAEAFADFDNVIHIASDFSELTIDELFSS
ncbi:HAD family hydrolase [Massilia antarctica]|uniref:HAD family hydrolase n=1 Tax=Massilia antarctica TaxID=2765360 RepID=UPI0006BB94A8|nr:HAD family phosphatase [Massilia sp. H27-R4]MCY0910347.1 HAD family phosphatase [Massilia sp. H27-R4]CUI09313.1 Beta-phosphoglucomutase [Janthinobacterium sp. CG23_2]CUU33099.1 Beta-phosphoglucomutase [Janthinobacterium sp. CG23_2]